MKETLFIFLLIIGTTCGEHKRWIHSTNWEDGANWDAGRPPCSKDRVQLPPEASSVFIQTNTSITEIVLPMNGELTLGPWVTIAAALPNKNDDNCATGKVVRYTRKDSLSWYDPSNWCSSTDIAGGCKATQPDLLDTEQVPCSYDSVTFPQNSAFLVNLGSGIDITTGKMHFSGKTYTTGEFRTFLQSKEGQRQFKRDSGTPTTVKINSDECSDETGCACGNDRGMIFEAICNKQTCPELSCHKSVLAIGACCPTCGAVIQMSYDHRNFHYSSFKNKIYNRHLHDEKEVKAIFSKTSTDYVQIALTDSGSGDDAARVGRKIREAVNQDSAGAKEYGITKVDLYTSENVQPTAHGHTGKQGLQSGSVVGIIIAILIIISLIGLGLFCLLYRRQRERPPLDIKQSITDTWSRISHRMRSQDLEKSRDQDKVTFGDLASFENPMFNQPVAEASYQMQQRSVQDVDPADPAVSGLAFAMPSEPGFSNPLYGQNGNLEEYQHGGMTTSVLNLNPVFTTEGIEDDSSI